MKFFFALLFVFVSAACDSSDSSSQTIPGNPDGGAEASCSVVSSDDAACESVNDCAIVSIPSCCTAKITGVAEANAECFREFERNFDASACSPDLGCAGGIEADSGESVGFEDDVVVDCVDSRCVTSLNN